MGVTRPHLITNMEVIMPIIKKYNYQGHLKTASQLSYIFNITKYCLHERVRRGWLITDYGMISPYQKDISLHATRKETIALEQSFMGDPEMADNLI